MAKSFIIKDIDDYKRKLDIAYQKWQKTNFSEQWIENFENYYSPSTNLWNFVKLLRARKKLPEEKYKKLEEKIFKDFEEIEKILLDTLKVFKAEEEAFRKAGIKEGKVTYTCPLCGGTAVAVRYKYGGRYHGLGSHCPNCGFSHT